MKDKRLVSAYKNFRKTKPTKSSLIADFRKNIGVILFRTTKLEGEPVTKKMITSLLK